MASAVRLDDWELREAAPEDIDALVAWFASREEVLNWGGPTIRYPFTREIFLEDICWDRLASFSLYDSAGKLMGFGQACERFGRIHLARLVVHPAQRGRGFGKRLIDMLMIVGRQRYDLDAYSLFVFRDNERALECYKSMGFVVSDCPDDVSYADACLYLTRPLK